ncbi:S1 RNA-binding domain-containing protein [Catenovulum maritimum]|uniref:GntR family transcriptional regulator n=1 Tax=Catenovulum maritimum TaxID=1513271 RepID=A0A0J8GQT2_9ALTE|nr:S1-like domain-containing RNA-binding protein [Catenovulum maritimum]KMT65072.1 GntR family transcriptional regulator [Catenovulum maritimum]
MLTAGKSYQLKIVKNDETGIWLDAQNLGEVLLPKKLAPKQAQEGDLVWAYLYHDSKERLTATTQKVKAQVGEFACLKVVSASAYGVFVDLGLDKDVIIPQNQQKRDMEIGRKYLVYLYLDEDGRITATAKTNEYLDQTEAPYEVKDAVNLLVLNESDLGYNAIINHAHRGVLYRNEVFERLEFGQFKKGFIKRIRPDGKIDLILQAGKETRDKYSASILKYLEKNDGFAPFHDKSSPEEINKAFAMSKAAFKKAIGGLYKTKKIKIESDGIRLI